MKKKKPKKPKIRNLVHKHAHEFNRCKVIDSDRKKYTRKGKNVNVNDISKFD